MCIIQHDLMWQITVIRRRSNEVKVFFKDFLGGLFRRESTLETYAIQFNIWKIGKLIFLHFTFAMFKNLEYFSGNGLDNCNSDAVT